MQIEDFAAAYAQLGSRDQARFAEVVSSLLGGQFIMPEGAFAFDTNWQFLVRHQDLIGAWLAVARFDLVLDEDRQIATAAHRDGRHRQHFDKFTSLVLCQLRLFLHEAMTRDIGEDDVPVITLGELREALQQAGYEKRIPASRLHQVMLDLRRADLVHFESRLVSGRDTDRVTLSPALERALSPAKLEQIHEQLREYLKGKDEASEETTA